MKRTRDGCPVGAQTCPARRVVRRRGNPVPDCQRTRLSSAEDEPSQHRQTEQLGNTISIFRHKQLPLEFACHRSARRKSQFVPPGGHIIACPPNVVLFENFPPAPVPSALEP